MGRVEDKEKEMKKGGGRGFIVNKPSALCVGQGLLQRETAEHTSKNVCHNEQGLCSKSIMTPTATNITVITASLISLPGLMSAPLPFVSSSNSSKTYFENTKDTRR